MKQSEFFKAFRAGGDLVKGSSDPLMLKVKDYPPDAAFAEQMPRHWQVSFAYSFLFCSEPADAQAICELTSQSWFLQTGYVIVPLSNSQSTITACA